MTENHTSDATLKSQAAATRGGSAFSRYRQVVVGRNSLGIFLLYEWCSWLAIVPGALGIFLRKIFWPHLLGSCGKGVVFGANVVLRHPHRIHLGDRVVLSEGCILDARNDDSPEVIVLGEDVILSNNIMISCKQGSVRIGARSGLGAQTILHSTSGCPVAIGSDVIIGPRCYLVGGSNYHIDRLDIPIWRQGIKSDGGVVLADDIWLGANVTVLGGVKVGTGSVIAAGAVVTKSIPPRVICKGLPAKVTGFRESSMESSGLRSKLS